METDLSQFLVVQENPNYLLLQKGDQLFIYKEFPTPIQIGKNEPLPPDFVFQEFQRRQAIKGEGALTIEKVVQAAQEDDEPRLGLLFESYVKNFDEELTARRGTDNFWTEEELFNTFQACLSGLKIFHDCEYVHGSVGPQSIIFSQEGYVKIADHFVVSDVLKKNWLKSADQPIEYGYWAPEIIAEWTSIEGWSSKFETMEADLWGLGLVFLESMILQSSFEIYFDDGENQISIDSSLLAQRIQLASETYSPLLMGLIDILLAPDPRERTWARILSYNQYIMQGNLENVIEEPEEDEQQKEVEQIANSLGKIKIRQENMENPCEQIEQLPEFRTSCNQSVSQIQEEDINNHPTKTKLTEMLESCLQKSKDLIKQNESRKKLVNQKGKDNQTYFTLNQQNTSLNNQSQLIQDQPQYIEQPSAKNKVVNQKPECKQQEKTQKSSFQQVTTFQEIDEKDFVQSNASLNSFAFSSVNKKHDTDTNTKRKDQSEVKQHLNYDLPRNQNSKSAVLPKESQISTQQSQLRQNQIQQNQVQNQQVQALKINTQQSEKQNESKREGLKEIQNIPQSKRIKSNVTKIDYDNEITYIGNVKNVQSDLTKQGFGTLLKKDDRIVLYEGLWKDDSFNGLGDLTNFTLDPSQIDPNLKCNPQNFNNLQTIWKHYHGEFEDGLMNGKGQLTLVNGSIFSGNFYQGAIDGYGMFIEGKGKYLIGIWRQNQLIQILGQSK